ncbi:hypothetical protein VTK73DRAFT_5968 [Phialemonium thermophilum]|uniref:Protein kinase domain-containing protein n=1 Tax=Phialemonium thermophilum TaxID=223376 RepID=A0ABR3WKW6_9PEZI
MDDKQEAHRPRYEVETYCFSNHDDNSRFAVRRNGVLFHIRVSPSQFVNSPATTQEYLSYLEVLRSGEEVIGDIFDTDVYDWVTRPFEQLFVELAPPPVLPEGRADITITLKDHLYPPFFVFDLCAVDEQLQPHRIETDFSPYFPPRVWLDDDYLDEVEKWTTFYDPADVVLRFGNPEDALFKPPRKVLVNDGKTACFFKPCYSTVQTKNELEAYRKIASSKLDPQLRICRLFGLVTDDNGAVLGLLLTYIDHNGGSLASSVDPHYPSPSTKKGWVDELEAAVAELHRAGIVWGDVKAQNVLVDREDHVWITDFGGGYTEGWVERERAGTVEGDLAGLARLREFVFQDASQDRWWTR